MKWYNKDKTACLDLDRIGFWTYNHNLGDLNLFIGGASGPLVFNGPDAIEIYKMLTSQKEVI